MSENIGDLRDILFNALRDIQSGAIDLDKAKAINETAQTIINTAKVEVDYARVTGAALDSTLLAAPAREKTRPGSNGRQLPEPEPRNTGKLPPRGLVGRV